MSTHQKDSKFELVVVAGARARQLLEGCVPRVEPAHKKVKTALREVKTGAVARRADELKK
jgi:DNA-directed RNA polymerase omega subunit